MCNQWFNSNGALVSDIYRNCDRRLSQSFQISVAIETDVIFFGASYQPHSQLVTNTIFYIYSPVRKTSKMANIQTKESKK